MPDTNLPFDPTRLKFGVGQPVPRQEDPKLLQGQGRYTDDLALPGQLYAYVVRSPYAHAVLNGVDVTAARAAPGVHAVITAADLAAPVTTLPPTATAAELMDLLADGRQQAVPILDGDRLAGLVTRSDLIALLSARLRDG